MILCSKIDCFILQSVKDAVIPNCYFQSMMPYNCEHADTFRFIAQDCFHSYSDRILFSIRFFPLGNQCNVTCSTVYRNETHGIPVPHRVRIVKPLTQHVVRGDSWVPTNGIPPCWWWGYQSEICIHDWFEMGCHFSPSLIQLG